MVGQTNTVSKTIASKVLFDQTYLNNKSGLSHVIILSEDTLCHSHFDVQKNKYISFSEYSTSVIDSEKNSNNKLEAILKELEINASSQPIKVSYASSLYTLIPKVLFDKDELESYLTFSHKNVNTESYNFGFDVIESLDVVLVYAIPNAIKSKIDGLIPLASLGHSATSLLEAALLKNPITTLFQIHIKKDSFDAVLLKKGKLQFLNSFPYHSVEDFIYYLMYVIEQLDIDREKQQIELVGEFEEDSALYKMLFKYIRNLKIAKRPATVNYSAPLHDLPKHYYYNLFTQHLCE